MMCPTACPGAVSFVFDFLFATVSLDRRGGLYVLQAMRTEQMILLGSSFESGSFIHSVFLTCSRLNVVLRISLRAAVCCSECALEQQRNGGVHRQSLGTLSVSKKRCCTCVLHPPWAWGVVCGFLLPANGEFSVEIYTALAQGLTPNTYRPQARRLSEETKRQGSYGYSDGLTRKRTLTSTTLSGAHGCRALYVAAGSMRGMVYPSLHT
eukprot:6208703-Pleurochrysis_carterae.AAC.2